MRRIRARAVVLRPLGVLLRHLLLAHGHVRLYGPDILEERDVKSERKHDIAVLLHVAAARFEVPDDVGPIIGISAVGIVRRKEYIGLVHLVEERRIPFVLGIHGGIVGCGRIGEVAGQLRPFGEVEIDLAAHVGPVVGLIAQLEGTVHQHVFTRKIERSPLGLLGDAQVEGRGGSRLEHDLVPVRTAVILPPFGVVGIDNSSRIFGGVVPNLLGILEIELVVHVVPGIAHDILVGHLDIGIIAVLRKTGHLPIGLVVMGVNLQVAGIRRFGSDQDDAERGAGTVDGGSRGILDNGDIGNVGRIQTRKFGLSHGDVVQNDQGAASVDRGCSTDIEVRHIVRTTARGDVQVADGSLKPGSDTRDRARLEGFGVDRGDGSRHIGLLLGAVSDNDDVVHHDVGTLQYDIQHRMAGHLNLLRFITDETDAQGRRCHRRVQCEGPLDIRRGPNGGSLRNDDVHADQRYSVRVANHAFYHLLRHGVRQNSEQQGCCEQPSFPCKTIPHDSIS